VGHIRVRRRLQRAWSDLPHLTRLGLLVLLLGAAADLTFHALPNAAAVVPWLGADGFRAHLVTFVGMFVMLVGVFRQGLSGSRSSTGVVFRAHR
jgi:hypothetical protein